MQSADIKFSIWSKTGTVIITGTLAAIIILHRLFLTYGNKTLAHNKKNDDDDDRISRSKLHSKTKGGSTAADHSTTKPYRRSGNQFLVIPDVESYDNNPFPTHWRLVIEYNDTIGPVAVHFENGLRWGFLSACLSRHKKDLKEFIKKWNIFLEDYHRDTKKYAARAGRFFTDSFYLTLSSQRVLLNDMLVGENLFRHHDDHDHDNNEDTTSEDEDMTQPRRQYILT
jgi:hypothetical protein